MAICRIELFGGLRVTVDNRAITRFQTQKTGALLAYLALHVGRYHPRESLAELLWPGDEPVAIRNRLNQAVSSLRRQLHPPGTEASSILIADHHTLSLQESAIQTDVQKFDAELKLAHIDAEDEVQIRHLRNAVSLYAGDLLAGYYEEWVLHDRLFYSERYIEALDRLIRLYVHAGQEDEAIELAKRRVDADPLDESGHVRLMRLYLRLRKPRAAMRQFEELRRVLATDGDEPGEKAQQFYAKAQLLAKEIPEEFMPESAAVQAPTVEARPAQVEPSGPQPILPAFFTNFIGREKEVGDVSKLLADPEKRLIMLVGPGGCGKTRLSVEVGRKVAESFGGNVVFVSAIPALDPIDLEELISQAIFGEILPSDTRLGSIAERLAQGERALLILDNLEQIEDQGATVMRALLERSSGLKILATSRQSAGIEGSYTVHVRPLPVPEIRAETTLADLAKNPSVALFVVRAQSVKQDFQLTDRTAATIVELCRRLEGLPLAIELAASWARSKTAGQMVEDLSERLDFLASRRRDIPERHRTMRAAIESSYLMLSEELRDTFVRLSVFRGGFTRESAQKLCPGTDIDGDLEGLEDHSLVFGQTEGTEARFSILELLRAFGESQMTPDLRSEVRWLHAEHFLEFVRSCEKLPNGKGAARLDQDLQNVDAAFDWLIQNSAWPQAFEMAWHLGGYWQFRGQYVEALRRLEKLAHVPEETDPKGFARLKCRMGSLRWFAGQFEQAQNDLLTARELLGASKDDAALLEVLMSLEIESHRRGDYDQARQYIEEIRTIADRIGDTAASAIALRRLGSISVEQRQFDRGLAEYAESLSLARNAGLSMEAGAALLNMGTVSLQLERYDASRQWLTEASNIFRESGFSPVLVDALITLARLYVNTGEIELAQKSLREAYSLETESWVDRIEALAISAEVCRINNAPTAAAQLIGFIEAAAKPNSMPEHSLLAERVQSLKSAVHAVLSDSVFNEHLAIGKTLHYTQAKSIALGNAVLASV